MDRVPVFKEIILVGGGHAHALVLKQWGMQATAGVRVTLISPQAQTPYSGMLPGLIAGHYNFDQIHIDLPRSCQWSEVRFIQDKVTGIDPELKTLQLEGRPSLHYDCLSVDIGSTPDHSIAGVLEHSSPIKPISGFYSYWKNVLSTLRYSDEAQTVAVVGGGAGSVETILAMAWAVRNDPLIKPDTQFKLVFRSATILNGFPDSVIRGASEQCQKMGISLHANFSVSAVTARLLQGEGGMNEAFDHLFWCTQASAPSWLAETGIACTDKGFIRVNEYLQSINYPDIFAAGDIAHMDLSPRPKAGVYAVRQAPILFVNLYQRLLGNSLKAYQAQDHFLALLSLGEKSAIGIRRPFPTFAGDWVWRWKDSIDRKFMSMFHTLPEKIMTPLKSDIHPLLIPHNEQQEKLKAEERCGGCGAKIGSGILNEVLTELTGSYEPEDASTIAWPADSLIQTIDYIKSPVDDPYLFGRIAVFHALSDLFAMNALAHSLHLAVTLPFAGRATQIKELRQLLQGVLSACKELKVELLGGHSAEGSDLSLAISANGLPGEQTFSKQGLRSGDLLVLSKPLGSGLILAGQMTLQTKGKDLLETLASMNTSNQATAAILSKLGVSACTDVTGFGLLGHLSEMLEGSSYQIELYLNKLPCLPGALELAKTGVRSSLFPQNELALKDDPRWAGLRDSPYWPLLLDPQTSGGLLAGIAADQAKAAKGAGLTVIGQVR